MSKSQPGLEMCVSLWKLSGTLEADVVSNEHFASPVRDKHKNVKGMQRIYHLQGEAKEKFIEKMNLVNGLEPYRSLRMSRQGIRSTSTSTDVYSYQDCCLNTFSAEK